MVEDPREPRNPLADPVFQGALKELVEGTVRRAVEQAVEDPAFRRAIEDIVAQHLRRLIRRADNRRPHP